MAMTATITYGSTTVNLTSGGMTVMSYTQVPPENDATSVTESMQIRLKFATAALLTAAVESIQRALYAAKIHTDQAVGDRVYLNVCADGVTTYRSEILYGRYDNWEDQLAKWANDQHVSVVTMTVTRAPYWEAATETELALNNANGSSITLGGLKIYNCADGAADGSWLRYNWGYINAEDIAGDLPAGVRLQMGNGTVTHVNEIIVGQNVFGSETGLLFREDGAYGAGVYDTSCSGNYYNNNNLGDAIEDLIPYSSGGIYRIFKRWKFDVSFSALVTPRLWIYGVNVWNGAPVRVAGNGYFKIYDLGAVRLPPVEPSANGATSVSITFTFSTDPFSHAIDFQQYMPTDGFIDLTCPGNWSLPAGSGSTAPYMVHDSILGQNYVYDALATNKLDFVLTAVGPGIFLVPNRTNFLWFLMRANNPSAADTITMNEFVRIWYRPRKASL